jgi:hypothetical protein
MKLLENKKKLSDEMEGFMLHDVQYCESSKFTYAGYS